MNWTRELVAIPVTDVDRAIAFYAGQVGFVLDHDHRVSDEIRFVQLTPPGSGCSICLGEGLTKAVPGSVEGMQVVVSDIGAAHRHLRENGVDCGEIHELPWGNFVYFQDPDGNQWAVQHIPARNGGA